MVGLKQQYRKGHRAGLISHEVKTLVTEFVQYDTEAWAGVYPMARSHETIKRGNKYITKG